MWSFLADLLRRTDGPCTVLVMDEAYREEPRQYRVDPRWMLGTLGAGVLAFGLLLLALVVFTPLRELIPGYGTAELRQEAREAAVRVAALEDSVATQLAYVEQLQQLMTGRLSGVRAPAAPARDNPAADAPARATREPASENWTDHEQPALPSARLPLPPVMLATEAPARYLASLQLPAQPPVSGLLTRAFDARTGHYAIDIAVEEGTMVRAIGDGYVIFSDWTHEGGFAIAVQHADGYVSVYKHNQRLLKRIGDRVRAREAVAVSGNSGEFTSGPHLHFELWDNGLAQDPLNYLIDL